MHNSKTHAHSAIVRHPCSGLKLASSCHVPWPFHLTKLVAHALVTWHCCPRTSCSSHNTPARPKIIAKFCRIRFSTTSQLLAPSAGAALLPAPQL